MTRKINVIISYDNLFIIEITRFLSEFCFLVFHAANEKKKQFLIIDNKIIKAANSVRAAIIKVRCHYVNKKMVWLYVNGLVHYYYYYYYYCACVYNFLNMNDSILINNNTVMLLS